MNYEQAVEYIHSISKFGSKLGLTNITKLLDLLGNPHDKLKFVHVGGTNGKGSTSNYIANILYQAGYRVGFFISPYIEKFTERIQVDFQNIEEDCLVKNVELIQEKIQIMLDQGYNHPTEFEVNTALGMLYFQQKACDLVVLEVGLGGRMDSTNVINTPLVSVICTIDIDHIGVLGDTIEQIAFEKAGIIKPLVPLVIYGDNPQVAYEVIEEQAKEKNAPSERVDFSKISNVRYEDFSYTFDFEKYKDLKINIFGEYQIKNACTAIKAVEKLKAYNITIDHIKKGLERAKWPGRLEIVSKDPFVLTDGAHNIQGIRSLKETILKYFPDKRKIFVMAVMRNKDYDHMIEEIFPYADMAVALRPDYERALERDILVDTISKYCANTFTFDKIEEGLDFVVSQADENTIICTFGSLYYIADVKKYFQKRV